MEEIYLQVMSEALIKNPQCLGSADDSLRKR